MSTVYLTTPIFYVNAEPHLGHAFNAILVDVLCRYYRQRGVDARFLTGTDEHGEKIAQSAAKQGVSPQDFVDRVSDLFRNTWPMVEVEPDDFIRTTEDRHKQVVSGLLSRLYAEGEIYKGEYAGLYCVGCERFLTEKELANGLCPDHGVAPQPVIEENYMFRMEKYREWLKSELEARPELIQPDRYRGEVLAILREPIGDLSISRPKARVSWGIPIPWDPDHVVYVWFDALLNYMSALGAPGTDLYEAYWPHAIHVIGKDILKQHGIFWPIMLKSAGLPLFKGLLVHGHWLIDAAKMSKSIGNVVRPAAMVERYGADAFRYYLMRDMVFGSDSDFSELALAQRRNSDLANDLGNLLSRVLTMISRYSAGRLPRPDQPGELEARLLAVTQDLPAHVDDFMAQHQIHAAIEEILQGVRKANQYVQESAPWALAKDPANARRVDTVLYHAAETLRLAAVLLYPVIPAKAVELLRQLGCTQLEPNSGPEWTRAWGHLPIDATIAPGEILFPKIDLAELKREFTGGEVPADTKAAGSGAAIASKGKTAATASPTSGSPTPVSSGGSNKRPTTSSPASLPAVAEGPADGSSTLAASDAGDGSGLIGIDAFQQVQLRVAEVVAAEAVPKAKKLLKLSLQVGDESRTVVSGIADHYSPEQLIGKKVVVVWNLKPVTLRGIESQGMILAAEDAEGHLSLVSLDRDLPSGGTVR